MRRDAIFIAVDVDDAAAADPQVARRLAEACPVDIFAQAEDGGLQIVEQNIDECVLCRLCLDAADAVASAGREAVKIIKLYDDGAVLV